MKMCIFYVSITVCIYLSICIWSASIFILEDGLNNAVKLAQSRGKHVVVAGCVPQAAPNGKAFENLSIVGVSLIIIFLKKNNDKI